MKIGFIGFGNMASAICEGLIKSGFNNNDIYASSLHYDKLIQRTNKYHINPLKDNNSVAKTCDVIILGVKPFQMEQVINEISDNLNNQLIISIAASFTFNSLIKLFNKDVNLVVTIPSTPIASLEGITICDQKTSLTKTQLETFTSLFSKMGLVEFVSEDKLDIASTLSGCGPAFISMVIESLSDAGVKHGLTYEESFRLVSKMVLGSAKKCLETKTHPAILKNEVCSPKGTTIKGVAKLEELGVRNAFIKAIDEIIK